MSNPLEIASQFAFPSGVEKVEPHGNGIINDTFVVKFSEPSSSSHARLGRKAILQRINPEVFPEPDLIMHNLALVLEHAASRLGNIAGEFLLPPIYKTSQDQFSLQDDDGHYWRATGFIEQTVTYDVLQSSAQAREAGAALGAFHVLLQDLPADQLQDTLPGFHDTPRYLQQFDTAVRQSTRLAENIMLSERENCLTQIERHRSLARLLVDAEPAVSPGIMHGDPKLNNILFDERSGKAVSIIDLDTVKPGYIHYDIGDCIRSCCNRAGEMPGNIQDVELSVKDFESILQGYLSTARSLLSVTDFDMLYDVLRLLPFELGLRFFTDYLNGDRYFKVSSPVDNLKRAQIQFQLLECIEREEAALRQIIDRHR